MSVSYLDSGGLSYFWNKIKSYVTSVMPNVPTNVSAFTNDAGYLTSYTETDPTVPSWAKASSKPSYTASEVGADASGTAASAVSTHNSSSSAHSDIRAAIPTNVSDLTNDAGYTTNTGTITGITMNGTSQGTSGVVDLGTVIIAHQDISGKLDKSGGTMTGALTLSGNPTSNLHAATKQYVDSHSGGGSSETENITVSDDVESLSPADPPLLYAGDSLSQALVNLYYLIDEVSLNIPTDYGDMHQWVYDSNGNGTVDHAESVRSTGGNDFIQFRLDANGKGEYRAVGASTWIPFLSSPIYTRLWTNNSPTSNFAAQDIDLGMLNGVERYDALRIVWQYNKNVGADASTWESYANTISTTYDMTNGKYTRYTSGTNKIFMGVVNYASSYAYMRRCWLVINSNNWSTVLNQWGSYTTLHFDQVYRANNANNDTGMLIPLLVDGVKY